MKWNIRDRGWRDDGTHASDVEDHSWNAYNVIIFFMVAFEREISTAPIKLGEYLSEVD